MLALTNFFYICCRWKQNCSSLKLLELPAFPPLCLGALTRRFLSASVKCAAGLGFKQAVDGVNFHGRRGKLVQALVTHFRELWAGGVKHNLGCAAPCFQPSWEWVIASEKWLFPCRAVRHVHVQKEPPGAGLPNTQRSHDLQLLDKPVLDHCQPQGTCHPLRPVHEAHGEKAQVRNGALSLLHACRSYGEQSLNQRW